MGFRSDILSKWLYLRVKDQKMKRGDVAFEGFEYDEWEMGRQVAQLYSKTLAILFFLIRTDGDCLSE